MSKASVAATAEIKCPVCRRELQIEAKVSKKEILQFKPVYMKDCSKHLELWTAADAADRKKK